jgi:hypothetical protein
MYYSLRPKIPFQHVITNQPTTLPTSTCLVYKPVWCNWRPRATHGPRPLVTRPAKLFLTLLLVISRLGGVVVSMLATGPKSRGFQTRQSRWIFKDDTKPQYNFIWIGVKPEVPCRKILWNLKNPLRYSRY